VACTYKAADLDWWYVIEGELDNGTVIEVFNNEGIFKWHGNPMRYRM
jgi:hypothetical protein